LKKRSKKLLLPRGFHDAGQIPYRAACAGIKRLLVLFFRKEHASHASTCGTQATVLPWPAMDHAF
jgi:hypothetical protein